MEMWTYSRGNGRGRDFCPCWLGREFGGSVSRMMRLNISDSDVEFLFLEVQALQFPSPSEWTRRGDKHGLANEVSFIEPSPSQYRGPIHSS